MDDVAAQVLPADDVPVSVGRPAHRPLVHRHARATRWRASAGCTATTCSSRSASTPSACPPRTPRSRAAAIRSRWTMQNIENMRRQFRTMGATFAWKQRGRHRRPVVLPLEPVAVPALPGGRPGLSARCRRSTGAPTTARWRASRSRAPTATAGAAARLVEKRDLEQWFLRTTAYADELLDFTGIDWPEPIRIQQTNWIGRSEGAEIDFEVAPDDHQPGGDRLRVFTTRPDTLFGATFMVLAPEHPLVAEADRIPTGAPRSRRTSSRPAGGPRSTGCRPIARRPASPLGADAINPVNGERIPIFIADYVLSGYGTGAIMAVPAHDERDFEFAKRFGLRDPAGRRRARARPPTRRWTAPTSPTPRTSVLVNSGRVRRAARRRGRQGDRRLAGRDRPGRAQGHLPPARLAGQPAALLGHARSRSSTARPTAIVPVPDDRPAGPPARDGRLRGQRRQPAQPRRGVPATSTARSAAARPGARPTPWTRSWTRRGTGSATCRRERAGRPGRPRDGRSLDAGRPVHRRRRARRHAPAVQPVLHQGDGRHRPDPRPRAVPAAVQPGPDPGRRRRADVEVARQRPGPRRAGRPLRRGHRPPVPDVHGPVGPGRAVEPDRDRRRPSLPEPGLDAASLDPHGREPGDPDAGALPAGESEADARRRDPIGRAPDAARRHRGLRGVPLQHDDRQAHGAGQHAVPLPRDGRRRLGRMGRGDRACCC